MCLQVHWKLVNLLHFLGNENVYTQMFEDLNFLPQPIQHPNMKLISNQH